MMICKFFISYFMIYCTLIHGTVKACDCFSKDDNNYKCHFAAKTPYRYIANYNDSQLRYSGCRAKKIWLIIRHGTRLPGTKDTSRMIDRLSTLRRRILRSYELNQSEISAETFEKFSEWKLNLTKDDAMKLTEEGERELTDLAERFQARFPNLFPESFSNLTYRMKYTPTQRTEESAKHFSLGLFGRRGSLDVWYPQAEENDTILRSYKHCKRWQLEVNKNPFVNEQINLFTNSKIVNDSLDEISKLIGFTIDYDIAYVMYTTCCFETAWKKDADSPWCRLFTLENFKVMEYAEDLDYFWIDGYGYQITYEQACPGFHDMFQSFQSETGPKATVYFSHSGSILKLIALLGLAKDDERLTHDSFKLHVEDRAWRVSRIDAFASNIAFILYECDEEGPSILIMHQERVVQIPGCPENAPCPFSIIETIFARSIYECNFAEICAI